MEKQRFYCIITFNHVMKRFCILYADSNKITCNSLISVITSYKNILQLNQSEQFKLRLFDVINVNTIEHVLCKL